MPVNVLYAISAKATGAGGWPCGYSSTVRSDVALTTPKELGGGGGARNNARAAVCGRRGRVRFIGAMKFVRSQGGLKVPADASVTSTVGIGPRAAGGFGLDIDLAVLAAGLRPRGSRGAEWRRPTRCAPTPMPRAAMSTFA